MTRIHLIPETGSTNADLRAQADSFPDGHWLRAERQTAGRGRLGRDWHSPTDNLYSSTLIRLHAGDPPVASLSLMLGVAVHDAIMSLVPAAHILLKWPNDLMVGPAKLAGMLLERDGDAIIAGIGINVAEAPALPDRQTIALNQLPDAARISAAETLDALIPAVDRWLAIWRRDGMQAILAAWQTRAHHIGTRLTVSPNPDQPIAGRFLGLDADGALILEADGGRRHVIHSGDVGMLA